MGIYIKHAVIEVEKSVASTVIRECKAWEVPLLEVKYPDQVRLQKYFWHEVDQDKAEEIMGRVESVYEHLQAQFGKDEQEDIFLVQMVYGSMIQAKDTLLPQLRASVKRADTKPDDETPEFEDSPLSDVLGDNNVLDELDESLDLDDDPALSEDDENTITLTMPDAIETREQIDAAIAMFGGDPMDEDSDEQALEMLGAFIDDALINRGLDIKDKDTVHDKFSMIIAEMKAA